jgi:hypothetical protein
MKKPVKLILFWTPRIFCVLFMGFLSLLAGDIFDMHLGFWKTILGLLIHLIPVGIVLLVLAVSWRWEGVGAILFNAMGLYYLMANLKHPHMILAIAGPLFLIGVLFLLNWLLRKELKTKS